MITNTETGTNIQEIAEGIYRISTPLPPSVFPGGFSFNQYLIVDEKPLLFHTGLRKMFPVVREAVQKIIPVENLAFLAFSHVEADECGSINDWLREAPRAVAVCSSVAAIVSMEDLADRPPSGMNDQEILSIGSHSLQWLDAPHLPHAWECGYFFETKTRTLLCGDLFTQPGSGEQALTESDILEPSESFRKEMDYYSHTKNAMALFEKLAATEPRTLACMHGSSWHGDGGALLRELGRRLA